MSLNTSGLRRGGINRVSWVAEAATCRERRGEWILLATRNTQAGARCTASQINRGLLRSFTPAGDYEARVEGDRVWARFLGDGDTA